MKKTKKTKKTKACSKFSKCSSCYGYGLWPDGTAPMGPIDASDGMGTIPCPSCKADANPTKKIWVSKEIGEKELRNRISELKKIHKSFLKRVDSKE